MDKKWRMTADKQAREYRKNKAYIQGVSDAGNTGHAPSKKFLETAHWIWVVEAVRQQLRDTHPDKLRFFVVYYGLDAPRYGRSDHATVLRLSEKLHVSRSTLCTWRQEIQYMMVVAAAQAGLISPF